jgi:MFS transporter, SET family, sugar efflux transporter
MALTAGWVVGPVLGSILATAAGSRVMLATTGSCALAQIVPMGFARTGSAQPGAHTASASEVHAERLAQRPKLREMLPLLAFTGLYVFVYAGEPIKYGYLPIYMRDDMHLPTAVSGAVIGIQPLIELILMPVAVVVARRIGMMHLMILGAALGVGANLCFAPTGDTAGMFAGQILMGGYGVRSRP